MTRLLDWIIQGADNVLTGGKFTIFVRPSLEILAQSETSDSHVTTVNQIVFEQISQDLFVNFLLLIISKNKKKSSIIESADGSTYWGFRRF
jgi:hypothetical protein